jgi:aldose 1-epimerase
MEETKTYCFSHSSGEDIYLFSLHNSKGTKVRITNYGAIITSFSITVQDSKTNDIVLGFDKIEDYLSEKYLSDNPFFGAAVGRYGNRIKDSRFSIDDKEYMLQNNNNNDHLHGGNYGFDKKVWSVDSFTEHSLILKYLSRDGEEGYPGNLDVTLRFELNDENELSYEYTATTDKPTAVNLTHHSYFNLDNGYGNIGNHYIKINASGILEQDSNFTVTGKLVLVENTPYDFRLFKQLNRDWNPATGYDQSFIIDKPDQHTPAAEAYSNDSGIKLQVYTSEPVVHLYTGSSIPSIQGKKGNMYGPFSGFCLETQVHPNAVNIPHFPNTILRPGQIYRHKTTYKLSKV